MHQYICKYSNNDHRSNNYRLRLFCVKKQLFPYTSSTHALTCCIIERIQKLGWGLENFLLHSLYKLTSSSYFYKMIVKYLFTKSNF